MAHVYAAHQVVVCDDSGAEVSVEMDGGRVGPARRVLSVYLDGSVGVASEPIVECQDVRSVTD